MLRGRWYRFGYACVNFGRLVSARDWLAAHASRAATCAASTRTRRFEIIGRLAADVMERGRATSCRCCRCR